MLSRNSNNNAFPFFLSITGVHGRSVPDQIQTIGVSEIHIHSGAMTEGYGNDIALIKLSRPAMLNTRVGWLACQVEKRRIEWSPEKCAILRVNKNRTGRTIDFRVFYVKHGLLHVELAPSSSHRSGVKLDRAISTWR